MEKMRLALDIDNYPELIILDNRFQEDIEDKGRKATTGKAIPMINIELLRDLLDVSQDIRLINLKTHKQIKKAIVFVDEDSLDVVYCIPRRSYIKKVWYSGT